MTMDNHVGMVENLKLKLGEMDKYKMRNGWIESEFVNFIPGLLRIDIQSVNFQSQPLSLLPRQLKTQVIRHSLFKL